MDLSHIKKKFIDEAEGLLTNLDNVLIELEKDTENPQHIQEAFRVMHTIKGASGMFGMEKIVEITHEVESLYDLVRNHIIKVDASLLELTFNASDHIRAILTDEYLTNEDNRLHHKIILENAVILKKNLQAENEPVIKTEAAEKSISTWNIIFYPDDELIRRAVNLIYTFQDLFMLGEYTIYHQPLDSKDENPFWNVFLVSDCNFEDIENALMFILDYCKIVKIASYNIFSPEEIQKKIEELQQREIEHLQRTEAFAATPAEFKHIKNIKNTNESVNKSTTRINVEASKLDSLMYLVSELVTTKSELLLSIKNQNELRISEAAEKIEKLSKQFSENAISIRLVSLSEMINRFRRLIRDLAKQLGKNIVFDVIGEDTELDKSILDAIGEPIMHIIRNNIDHGIEMPERRLEQGKPENGLIRFEAKKSGNMVTINISDDGNGIDTNYIFKKAVEKGFINPEAQLSTKEILDLIFLPGFSTAQSLSNVSGRGVGMDIVLKKIQEIKGEILINSEIHKGTSFTIKLQQTISIINTLLVTSANLTYAIPIEDIEACILEDHENLKNRQSRMLEFEKALIPYINLREKYSLDENNTITDKIIIINRRNKRYAIVVDNIIGEYQTSVKPLGDTFKDIRFLSGASLLGDGSIALLINTDYLWNEISMHN